MIKKQATIYICEHCGRKMLGAGAMARHERFCPKNPHNMHRCFDFCRHLKMTQNYNAGDGFRTEMLCTKRDVQMYSYKFEKCTNRPSGALDGLERMPLECNLFERMTEEDFKNRFW